MALKHSTIRPGLLVRLSAKVTGNVSYAKTILQEAKEVEDGAEIARWETERRTEIPDEHKEAVQIRGKARKTIASICSQSGEFGLLCPESRADELEKAVEEARALADAFNERAKITKVEIFLITGKIAQDDVEAVRAINSEVRSLFSVIEEGLQQLDVKKVREAADRARGLGQILSPEARQRVQAVVDLARARAREIVKAGEAAAVEIDSKTLEAIRTQRHAFLDLDGSDELVAPVEAEGRAVDLAPEINELVGETPPVYPNGGTAPQIELE